MKKLPAFSMPAAMHGKTDGINLLALWRHAEFTFEIVADFGAYRDLHRHRILTQERQFLCCDYGFYTPPEIQGTPYEEEYCHALHQAKAVYDLIAAELPEEAQYVVPMAYNIRWYFHLNLRALQWLCELRSSPAASLLSPYRSGDGPSSERPFPCFRTVFQIRRL